MDQSIIGTPTTKKNSDQVKTWIKAIVLRHLPLSVDQMTYLRILWDFISMIFNQKANK